MTRTAFSNKRLSDDALELVERMDAIIEQYQADGMQLTLRQLYYRLVAAGLVPNTQRSYDRVGRVLSDARMCGLIDWDAIVDRERSLIGWPDSFSVSEHLKEAASQLHYDLWAEQDKQVEVWVEKRALIDVVGRACIPYRVPHFACKGYVSQTALYEASQRIRRRYEGSGTVTVVLYLGDHDPSGIDMPRDIADRLRLFGVENAFVLERIALTHAQVRQYDPPPNPAKLSDSRARSYIRTYGASSWELDALEPRVIGSIIERWVRGLVDIEAMQRVREDESNDRLEVEVLAKSLEVDGGFTHGLNFKRP